MTDPILKRLLAVRLFVTDLERARRFYSDSLGLTLQLDEPYYLIYDVGGAMLIVEPVDPADLKEVSLVGRFAGISFKVDDIGTAYERLRRRNVQFSAPPETQPWGGTLAHFLDPDGNELTMVE